MKKQLAEDIVQFLAPIRERYDEIYNDDAYLHRVTKEGREKARESAAATMREVRRLFGFKPF